MTFYEYQYGVYITVVTIIIDVTDVITVTTGH